MAGLGSLQGFNIRDRLEGVRGSSGSGAHARGVGTVRAVSGFAAFVSSVRRGAVTTALSDLSAGGINRNLVYAANLIYRLAPNVLAEFEASQARTEYVGSMLRLNNHYDLALAYLF